MCEITNELTISVWVDIIQMIIAAGSALLLFLTFLKQGENDKRNLELAELEKENHKIQKELAELERKAKLADYFANLDCSIDTDKTSIDDGYGGTKGFHRDRLWKGKLEIWTIDNPIRINEIKLENSNKCEVLIESPHKFTNKIYGKYDKFKFIFKYIPDEFDRAASNSIDKEILVKLYYSDLVGNKYIFSVKIVDFNRFIQPLEILEEPAN